MSLFENEEKLGVIFPDAYSPALKYTIHELKTNKRNMNKLLKIIFRGFQAWNKIE